MFTEDYQASIIILYTMHTSTCIHTYVVVLGAHAPEGYSTCFACVSICLSVCYRSSGGSFHSNAQTKVRTALVGYSLDF